ncbi:hypothetical protein BDV98DRAFT_565794 [Pterulicium gracile]|uniref:Uncharacterized protein n=1 Tax=Pterulicium gracile TaxID=1884261 RepID=A0A5C3QLM1_9AGAR|nr:hypothetical protein BDV98DRAFT_565794 [Pterula gracilis]
MELLDMKGALINHRYLQRGQEDFEVCFVAGLFQGDAVICPADHLGRYMPVSHGGLERILAVGYEHTRIGFQRKVPAVCTTVDDQPWDVAVPNKDDICVWEESAVGPAAGEEDGCREL